MLIVLKSGSLNLLEPYRPVQACNGIIPFQFLPGSLITDLLQLFFGLPLFLIP
jgi:hypothetical protein